MKKIFKSRLFFLLLGVLISTVSTVLAYSYLAQEVGYSPTDTSWNVENTKEALDSIRDDLNIPLDNELKNFVKFFDVQVGVADVINDTFLRKVATNKAAVLRLLSTEGFRYRGSRTNLDLLDAGLVPTLSSNAGVIYSSQYDSGSWAAYRVFDNNTSLSWSSASNAVNNSFLGYDFGTNVNVKAAAFLNCGIDDTRYCIKDHKLQYSDDNSTWYDASTVSTATQTRKDFVVFNTLNDSSHRYWRLLIINAYASYVEIDTLQFYGV